MLGTHLLGWEPIGYVEWNKYCQQVIAARVRDGFLPVAPIFTDVREFVQSGAAREYRGFADVVTAGFPCQPFSVAGKQQGADDERNMWPATRDVIRDVQPESVLLENVRGLIPAGYLGTVIGDLADLGYVGKWGVISAGATGADHERERLWIVAHSERIGQQKQGRRINAFRSTPEAYRQTTGLVNAVRGSALPYVCREHDGLAFGVERLTALGNGQVPIVAATAWRVLG